MRELRITLCCIYSQPLFAVAKLFKALQLSSSWSFDAAGCGCAADLVEERLGDLRRPMMSWSGAGAGGVAAGLEQAARVCREATSLAGSSSQVTVAGSNCEQTVKYTTQCDSVSSGDAWFGCHDNRLVQRGGWGWIRLDAPIGVAARLVRAKNRERKRRTSRRRLYSNPGRDRLVLCTTYRCKLRVKSGPSPMSAFHFLSRSQSLISRAIPNNGQCCC